MLECHSIKYLGIECPGCGAQRSFIHLFNGEIVESLTLFPALLPIMFTFLFLGIHLVFKLKHGAKILTYSFATSALLMATNFIYKLCIN